MTLTPTTFTPPDVHGEFARRCAQLGLACWKLDLVTGALIEPEEPAALAPFLHAPAVRTMVQANANAMAQAEQLVPATPFPGWALAPFAQTSGEKRLSLSLVLVLSDAVADSVQFNMACTSAGLNPCNVRPVLQSVVRTRGFDLNQMLAVLTWTWDELVSIATQRSSFLETVRALTAAIEAKDPYTCGHAERVSLIAEMMGRAMKVDEQTIQNFKLGGLLHDVGKMGVPEAILTKHAKLSPSEITLVQRHPEIGYKVFKDVALLTQPLLGVLHHHERFDGMGFPTVWRARTSR
jgi:HD-GYP domain-containing protein (c-di-GMP phosphodiesterase class II)